MNKFKMEVYVMKIFCNDKTFYQPIIYFLNHLQFLSYKISVEIKCVITHKIIEISDVTKNNNLIT